MPTTTKQPLTLTTEERDDLQSLVRSLESSYWVASSLMNFANALLRSNGRGRTPWALEEMREASGKTMADIRRKVGLIERILGEARVRDEAARSIPANREELVRILQGPEGIALHLRRCSVTCPGCEGSRAAVIRSGTEETQIQWICGVSRKYQRIRIDWSSSVKPNNDWISDHLESAIVPGANLGYRFHGDSAFIEIDINGRLIRFTIDD